MPLSRHGVGTYLETNSHTCHMSDNIRPKSSQLAEPPWTDPGIKSGISMHDLISASQNKKQTKKEEKKHRRGTNG